MLRNVKVNRPQPISGETFKYFSGIVKEAQEIKLGFKTAGQIERIYVKEGDYVRTGQKIAQLDTKDYQLGVEAAQIQYDQLKDEVARMKQLYDSKSITGNDYEKATSGLKQLEKQIEANRQQIKMTRADILPTVGLSVGYTYYGNLKLDGMATDGMGNYFPFIQEFKARFT